MLKDLLISWAIVFALAFLVLIVGPVLDGTVPIAMPLNNRNH